MSRTLRAPSSSFALVNLLLVSLGGLALAACGKQSSLVDGQPAAQPVTLTITHDGAGDGNVTSTPAGIACGATCSMTVPSGTQVTLTAAPDATSTFTGWNGGGCTGTGDCTITVTSDLSIDATFAKLQYAVTIAPTGNGTGSVVSAPTGITCSAGATGTCAASFDAGTAITLTATADATSTFLGWNGGGCTGTAPCTFTPTADTTIQPSFALDDSLVVVLAGKGTGTVTSSDSTISCGTTCSHQYAPSTVVTLTAKPDAHSTFGGWSGGGCTGTGTCQVTIDQAKQVTATFALQQVTLDVEVSEKFGTVTSADGGIMNCAVSCTHSYDYGTVIMLTATAASNGIFVDWSSGPCAQSTTPTCQFTITANTGVLAAFDPTSQITFMKSPANTGTGTVTSSPAGINCGPSCSNASMTIDETKSITLTATPDVDVTFDGWTGPCTGTSTTCTFTPLGQSVVVTAAFDLKTFELLVGDNGNGKGTVTSDDPDHGIICGDLCGHFYDIHTLVTLTATPAAGSTFAGWSGACSGTGTCQVTMDATKTVNATFTLQPETLSVATTGGNGSGSVQSSPVGITCGAGSSGTCSASFGYGTSVSLAPTAATGSTFTGWSGACSGTGACIVPMTATTSVTAAFTKQKVTLETVRGGNGAGTLSSADGAIDCTGTCTASYDYGTTVTLTAAPSTGSTFSGWSGGGCSGTGSCVTTLTAATTAIGGNFALDAYPLTVTTSATLGGGSIVTSGDGLIACGSNCSATYDYGALVTLTAQPDGNSSFAGWGGACAAAGTSLTCSVSIAAATSVTAAFTCRTVTFAYTGAAQTYTVPACATRVHVEAWGAQGATGLGSLGGSGGFGGLGGYVKGDLAVTTGEVLNVYVGGQSLWNGGGAGSDLHTPGNGGDASDLRVGGTALTNRVLVAAGGGGGMRSDTAYYAGGNGGGGTCGTIYCGGAGGQGAGGSGGNASTAPGAGVTATDAGGAGGGGTDGPGAGGRASCETRYLDATGAPVCGAKGTTGVGGAGELSSVEVGSAFCFSSYGGTAGGGGGYDGGGGTAIGGTSSGSCGGGGGGGGSSWVQGATITTPTFQSAARQGLGQVTITPF